jgi:uncharacterized protein YndB with AHSA1/START domain
VRQDGQTAVPGWNLDHRHPYEQSPAGVKRRTAITQPDGCVEPPGMTKWATRRLPTTTDRIEKTIVLRAPRSRVWRAISDAREFGTWFRVALEGEFAEGATVRGRITYPGYEHLGMSMLIERIEPETLFSYRWHPDAIDDRVDYGGEPTTLVEFRLEDAPEGTRLTIVESGFDRIPAGRRNEAFRSNEHGWSEQIRNVERHVSAA